MPQFSTSGPHTLHFYLTTQTPSLPIIMTRNDFLLRDDKPMKQGEIPIRQATPTDIKGISHVRGAVSENKQTREQLAELGITPESVAESLVNERRGWVAEDDSGIVAFSIADRETGSLFALFVLPEYEGRGIGRRLLRNAVQWLWNEGRDPLWLTTGANTRAARFYESSGWRYAGTDAKGELRFELYRTVL
jgi:GNAT superfamily N-acetyltransferase